MKKVFAYFSMLLAIGLLSACSSDDDDNPFVGEWQLIEVRNANSGDIIYPSDKGNSNNWLDCIMFMANFDYKASNKDTSIEDWPPMTYCYDEDVLKMNYVDSDYYDSFSYNFSKNKRILELTEILPLFDLNVGPGLLPITIHTYLFKKK